jgi:hypothetical protein
MRKEKSPAAVALGRKGGIARKKALTPEQRSASARHAVLTRYGKAKPHPAPKPGRWYGLILVPEDPDPPKPSDEDFVGGVGAYAKMLDQAHANPQVVLWSRDRAEVVERSHQKDLSDRFTLIIDVDYDPTRFTIQREYQPDAKRMLKGLEALLVDAEGGQR